MFFMDTSSDYLEICIWEYLDGDKYFVVFRPLVTGGVLPLSLANRAVEGLGELSLEDTLTNFEMGASKRLEELRKIVSSIKLHNLSVDVYEPSKWNEDTSACDGSLVVYSGPATEECKKYFAEKKKST